MKPILKVKELETSFYLNKERVTFVDKVTFQVNEGEILGIVGESGSGKSLTALSIMGILSSGGKVTGGSITLNEHELTNITEKELDKVRGNDVSMIFQDTMSGLNPVFTIGSQMIETMVKHLHLTKKEARLRAIELLEKVGLTDAKDIMKRYPHTLSGGMRQRVMIAMALSSNPKLLIADEPTTALDVTIQAQIMDLLLDIKKKTNTAIILITHDLGVVASVADRVAVMYAGRIVETGTAREIFYNPSHPYTKALLKSLPDTDMDKNERLVSIPGTPPDLINPPVGCGFASRCQNCMKICKTDYPEEFTIEGSHYAACWLHHQDCPTEAKEVK